MKIVFTLFALLLTAIPLRADSLAWNASPSVGITNYIVYGDRSGQFNLATASVKVSVGTNLTWTLTNLAVGNWTFAVTAGGGGLESLTSNLLTLQILPLPATDLRRTP